MKDVIIPLDLFDELIGNTIECLNAANNRGAIDRAAEYQKDLYRCNEIQKDYYKHNTGNTWKIVHVL